MKRLRKQHGIVIAAAIMVVIPLSAVLLYMAITPGTQGKHMLRSDVLNPVEYNDISPMEGIYENDYVTYELNLDEIF